MGVSNGEKRCLMSGGWPLWSMGWLSTVGSISVTVAGWSHVDGVL